MAIEGRWNLQVATPFGKYPATLFIEGAGSDDGGGAYSAKIDSRLGTIALENFVATGDSFEAAASYAVQGRTYDARITATADGDQMDGTINVKLLIAPPVHFTGTRAT